MSCIQTYVPGDTHTIADACFQRPLLMLPNGIIKFIIGYWFTRAQKKYSQGIKIFAFIFLSNIFHMLPRDTSGNNARIMCYFEPDVAGAINEELERKGPLEEKHNNYKTIDEEGEFLKTHTYLLRNAVKTGPVNTAKEKTGWWH